MTQRGSVRIAKTDPKCMSEEAESCGKAAAGTVLPFLQKQADIVNIYKKKRCRRKALWIGEKDRQPTVMRRADERSEGLAVVATSGIVIATTSGI